MRLINVAPMLEQLDLEHYDKDWYVSQYNADWISSWLDSQPVIEAEPVKHGQWEVMPAGPVAVYGCSLCRTEIPFGKFPDEMKFCHNCGAKMDLEGNKRFVIERHNMDAWSFAAIITDTYTGERFLFVRAGDAGGLVKLEG